MREQTGNLWDLVRPGDALVITTNGDVNKRGQAVMGRGIALQAAEAFEGVGLRERLGWMIRTGGNLVWRVDVPAPFALIAMPVKHHWYEDADPELIANSARQLLAISLHPKSTWPTIWLPRPGCGNGRLLWADVKPLIEPVLDDRFVVVNR